MNLLSNNNHILRGAAIPTAGGDVYNSGWEYTPEGEISGYSGSAIYTGEECPCDSAAIVDSAFNKSTAWVDEQNYLTEHQDVTNLPYVQNSALEFSPQGLISGISGSGFYAASAEGALNAETANFAYNAEHADSADSALSSYTAQFANSASSALNSEVANVAYTALTANFLDGGWEHDDDGFITAYNNSAFAGAGGGGRYEGISPIVVNNEEMRISAKSALLGVQEPLYFVEDSETATVIGIYDSAFSGRDWTDDIQSASSYAYDQATAQIPAVTGLPYVENSALDYTPGGHLVSSISGDALYAVSAEGAFTAETANYTYVAESANYVADGWEYNASNEITGYSGSAFHAESPSEGKIYTGISPIVVDNSTTTGTISAQTARLGVQSPLYFVEDTSASTVIGISGLPEVEGLMYESALNFGDGYITGYNSSALSSERSRYAVSSTSANGAISSQSATVVTGGWETANGKITGYNGTAFYTGAGNTYDVKASANISVSTAGNTFTVSGKDWTNTITEASSYAYNQATANATGKYIPYTNITTGVSGTTVYNVASGIRITAASGWVEMHNQNKENESEAHLQVAQNYTGNKSFWAELDGAGGGFLQMNWNSGTVSPNAHSSYSDGTCSSMGLFNGVLVYRSANSALTSLDDEASKVWQIGSERLRFWNQWGTASFGPRGIDVYDSTGNNHWYTTATDGAARFRIEGSAGGGARGAVDLTPGYINFYNADWSLNQSLSVGDIAALKALLNHVQSASASWVNPSTATGSI